ncbi:MAG: hypothetical protein KJZ80_09950 [Hyphomicrobiaceae bacterium]|nr:hypothetical protein [Hyphomicrobiaceae bacterium]
MQTLKADETTIAAVAEAARSHPVKVVADGEPAFVAVDPEEFERLVEVDRDRRRKAGRRLKRLMDDIGAHVAANATPEEIAELERMLIDED